VTDLLQCGALRISPASGKPAKIDKIKILSFFINILNDVLAFFIT